MHFRGLDLNLLIALDVLLRERNITRAGDRLGLSQPATSGALARLRDYFHDPLLVQVGRQMQPTPLAETLVEPVADVLRLVQSTVATKTRFDPRTSDRRFSIAASDCVFTIFIPEVIRRIERDAPSVTLQLRQLPSGWQEDLHRGDVDFVLVPDSRAMPDAPIAPLFDDGLTCVAWKGNARLQSKLTMDQYFELGHVVAGLPGTQEPSWDEIAVRKTGRARRIEIVAPTYGVIPRLLVGTERIATMWNPLARDAARHLPVKLFDPPFEIPRLREVLQWSSRRASDPGTIWLRSVIQEAAASMDAPAKRLGVA